MSKSFDETRPSEGTSSSTSNNGRRTSSPSYTLPPLPPSTDSLTSGTSIPAPAPPPPIPPPTSAMSMPLPMTPPRKPILRQKSPLSNEAYFASTPSSMPGAFPTSPPANPSPNTSMPDTSFTTHVYASSPPPSPGSNSPKRPSSIRNLLPFKAMRKSYDSTSPDSPGFRPASPAGGSSITSSRPSLNKKISGSFWKRKSSMGMSFLAGDEKEGRPSTAGTNETTEDTRSPTPGPGGDIPTIRRRKSGTFWRRRSSLGLATAFGTNGMTEAGQNGGTNGSMNGEQDGMNGHKESFAMEGQENEKPLPLSPTLEPETKRSYSPPPQLPAFIGGGGSLGGEDLFKDIQ